MYASNKYDRELMRVPQNYAGNAFAAPRQSATETSEQRLQEQVAQRRQVPLPQEAVSAAMADTEPIAEAAEIAEAAAQEVAAEADPDAVAEDGEAALAARAAVSAPILGGAIGKEELLILGLMALTHGDRSADNPEKQDEIGWLLLLLLLLG